MNHVVEVRDCVIRISQHRKIDVGVLRLVDVIEPLGMRVERVDADGQDLDVAARELILEFGGRAQLGSANWREVFRMREQQAPTGAARPQLNASFAMLSFISNQELVRQMVHALNIIAMTLEEAGTLVDHAPSA